MNLRRWFRLHAFCTVPFAVPMLVAPGWLIELLTSENPPALAIDLSRLVGAAYLLIAMLTWEAARRFDGPDAIRLARVFCIYESVGVAVGSTIHFDSNGDIGRWITIGFFAVFAAGYLWFGFIEPRLRRGETGSTPRTR